MNTTGGIVRELTQLMIPKTKPTIGLREDKKKVEEMNKLQCQIALDALSHMDKGELRKLDSLAGDTACQARASKAIIFYEVCQKEDSIKRHLQRNIKNLTALKNCYEKDLEIPKEMGNESLSEDEKFIILAHMLCLTRDKHKPRMTNAQNLLDLTKASNLSLEEMKEVVRMAQTELSKRSTAFLQQEARDLSLANEVEKLVLTTLARHGVGEHRSLKMLPCYVSVQIVMENVKARETPLVLVINRLACNTILTLTLQSKDKKTLQRIENSKTNEVALVIEGESRSKLSTPEYLDLLLGTTKDVIDHYPHSRVMEVILKNAAKHPVYPGKGEDGQSKRMITYFQKSIPGITMLIADQNGLPDRIPMPLHHIFDQVVTLSNKKGLKDYRALLDEVVGVPLDPRASRPKNTKDGAGKLAKGLVSACNPLQPGDLCEFYVRMKLMEQNAEKAGLCSENPEIFAVKHIYADLASNHPQGEKVISERLSVDLDDEKEVRYDEE